MISTMQKVLALASTIDKMKELQHAFEGIYQVKSSLVTNNILAEVGSFVPECIVVYLESAMRQRLFPMMDFREDERFKEIPMLLIANEKDREVFESNILYGPSYELPEYSSMESIRTAMDRLMAASGIKKHILVVDDDLVALKVVKGYLEKNFKVTCVKSGAQALKFLEKQFPDCILLDCYMPEMDGPTTLKKIRIMDRGGTVPVVFLTGNSEKDMVMRSLSLHPSGFLLKPINQKERIDKLNELV